jgi:copper chaperone
MNYQETVFEVQGLSCPSCVRHINAALGSLDGVGNVEVRLRDGRVVVQHDPSVVDANKLAAALSEAGYESALAVAA